DELNADWDQGRPPDSTLKSQDIYNVPGEQLLFDFGRAASYSSELAKAPDSFLALLREAKAHAQLFEPPLVTPEACHWEAAVDRDYPTAYVKADALKCLFPVTDR